METQHLRSLPSDDSDATDDGTPAADASSRAPARARARHALPTDRMKFAMGVDTLKAFAIKSRGGDPVGGEAIAQLLNIAVNTAVLNNTFFMESGLITRVSKGLYKPVPEVVEFTRLHSLDDENAGKVLGPIMSRTWAAEALRTRAQLGPMKRRDAMRMLADESGAEKSHLGQIGVLLDWLTLSGVISTNEDGTINVGAATTNVTAHGRGVGIGSATVTVVETPLPGAEVPVTTTEQPVHQDRGPVVLAWSFSVQFTADDIAKLSPEQITALFTSAGSVAAIKP
jgi:hypothetical protein